MIWVVSEAVSGSAEELENRRKYIQEITGADVSRWNMRILPKENILKPNICIYQCVSHKGEYGIIITAHIGEVPQIIEEMLTNKRAIVVINSCEIKRKVDKYYLEIVKERNSESKLFFAKQEILAPGFLVNYSDNVGTFGFSTTLSERELFIHRHKGIIQAIKLSYNEVC